MEVTQSPFEVDLCQEGQDTNNPIQIGQLQHHTSRTSAMWHVVLRQTRGSLHLSNDGTCQYPPNPNARDCGIHLSAQTSLPCKSWHWLQFQKLQGTHQRSSYLNLVGKVQSQPPLCKDTSHHFP